MDEICGSPRIRTELKVPQPKLLGLVIIRVAIDILLGTVLMRHILGVLWDACSLSNDWGAWAAINTSRFVCVLMISMSRPPDLPVV